MEGATDQLCCNLKLQEEHGGQVPQAQSHGLEHGTKSQEGLLHDAAWVEYLTQPRVPEGAVHLIIGDSLLRVLTRKQSHWQTGILNFAGAAMPQILASLEMLGMARVYTVTLMNGTNEVRVQGESRKVMKLHDKMSCILEELQIQMDPAILTVYTIPYNMTADQHAMEMNTKVNTIKKCPFR